MERFTVRVEKMVYGGEGLAYHEGRPVFVPFVLPGEVVDVFPFEESRKLIRALPGELREAAGERIEPGCPYFGRCGGCQYQHLPYEKQVALKEAILRESLRRLGKIEWEREIRTHPSPPWNYRNRVQLKLGPHPFSADRLAVGYYRAASHALLPVEECPISSPKLNEVIAAANRLSREQALPPALRSLEAFVDDRDEALWLTAGSPELAYDRAALAENLRTALDGVLSLRFASTAAGAQETDGLGWIATRAGPYRLRVSHGSFFQVNRHLAATLLERATQGLEGRVALDLYAGVGLFARGLAERFSRVVAVESNLEAVADLEANLAELEQDIEIYAQPVADYLRGQPEKCDAVVVDPPRTGLERAVPGALAELGAPRLVYLSCDPATLARDLARLRPAYRLLHLELIDLFPQTFHIEALARLERAD